MTRDELIDKTNKAISELVYEKKELLKAYNYYNGIRDANQFKYLEENFGLGNPTSIEFIPLIRKHVDALIGEYLGSPIIPKVQCKDAETISNIEREKLLKIISEINSYLTKSLKNSILSFVDGKNTTDPLIEEDLKKLIEGINTSFVSEYEIAALNVIEYIMLSRQTDLGTALRILFLDLIITGLNYYKVEPTPEDSNIKIRALDPRNVFVDFNFDSPYVKHANRAVIRNWMTKTQILAKYGKDLSRDDVKNIKEHWESLYDSSSYYIKHNLMGERGILAGDRMVVTGLPQAIQGTWNEFIPVYEVEWIEVDKDFKMDRYECTRIGEDIYILKGKDEHVIRSKDNPKVCSLAVNGIFFLNRGDRPYSLVLACASLQD